MIDVSLYTGFYPFRYLPPTHGRGIFDLMKQIGCEWCVATAFPSIFYKDCLDGLKRTIDETEGCGEKVFHYAVINPAFPGWQQDLDEALKLPGVVGVRLFPRYHHYDLCSKEFLKLMETTAERNVPVNLTARLVDERLGHWLIDGLPSLQLYEIEIFLKKCRNTTVIMSMFDSYEYNEPVLPMSGRSATLLEIVKSHPNAFIDIGGCTKPNFFWFEKLVKQIDPSRLILGTGAPLYYHGGTLFSLEKAKIESSIKMKILHDNAQVLFRIGGDHANH